MELLRKIMSDELFSDFFLVGGTSLSLLIGHRNSIDIDLFGNAEINPEIFIAKLSEFGDVKVDQSTKNILIIKINDVKVDFVNYKYPLLTNPNIIDNIRMLSKIDIGEIKCNCWSRFEKRFYRFIFFIE